jgi:uncharacterized protein
MKALNEQTIPNNTGTACTLKKGQRLRLTGETIIDVVAFDLHDLDDRLDQATTKALQKKIFLTAGDRLLARSGKPLLAIVADSWRGGTHDLEKGMCSASAYAYQLQSRQGKLEQQDARAVREAPNHGCWENLATALAPWKIAARDVPNPFNVFMTMAVDSDANRLGMTRTRPTKPEHIEFEAEMDCLVGISACPDTMVGGKPVGIVVYEA